MNTDAIITTTNPAFEISNSLKQYRAYLEKLEKNVEIFKNELNLREERNLNNLYKLDYILNIQNQIINFEINGKIITCNREMILNCEYETILKELIINNNDNSNIILDRNRKYLRIILDLIRKKDDQNKKISTIHTKDNNRIEFHLPHGNANNNVYRYDPDQLKEELKYYFKTDSYEKIFQDFKIIYNEDGNNPKVMRGNKINPTDFLINYKISQEFPNERLNDYKLNKLEDILKKDNYVQAIFTDYESNVIFELSEEVKVKQIQMKPFWADLDVWFPGDGAGCLIYSSIDNVNWELISEVPLDYGCDIDYVHEMNFEEKLMKFVKIDCMYFPISITYLKLG